MSQRQPTDNEATKLAEEFILHGDQVRAWRIVYSDSEASEKSHYERSSLGFKTVKVRSRIEELQALSKKNSEEEFTMTVSELKKMLVMVIKKGLKEKKDAQDNEIAHNLGAAVSAIAEFNKMDGNHSATEIKGDLTVTNLLAEIKESTGLPSDDQ